jgi:hypothetical protein
MQRSLVNTIAAFLLAVALPVCAQNAKSLPRLELIRGLTAKDMPDLSLELLTALDKAPNLPEELAAQVMIEMARAYKVLAEKDPDPDKRGELYLEAHHQLERFLKKAPGMTETAEANWELAQVAARLARIQYDKANQLKGADRQTALLTACGRMGEAYQRLAKCPKADLDKVLPLFGRMLSADLPGPKSKVQTETRQQRKPSDAVGDKSLASPAYEPVGAKKILAKLSANSEFPEEFRQECRRTLDRVNSREFAAAMENLQQLLRGGLDKGVVPLLKIAQAECMVADKKQILTARSDLKDIIFTTTDAEIRALAFNALGECCFQNKETRKSLFNYLYVEVIYNQNRDEVQRAQRNLLAAFSLLGDEDKARRYREILEHNQEPERKIHR